MIGAGIAYGIIGAATIGSVLYMAEHGYAWWQMALMVVLGLMLCPSYRHEETRES